MRARSRDDRFAQTEQLGARTLVERDPNRVHRFERSGEAARALARAAGERRDFSDLLGQERDDDVRLAVVHHLDDECARNMRREAARKRLTVVGFVGGHRA